MLLLFESPDLWLKSYSYSLSTTTDNMKYIVAEMILYPKEIILFSRLFEIVDSEIIAATK